MNKTETGTWGVNASTADSFGVFVPISFTIPLETALDAAHAIYVPSSGPNPDAVHCPGNAADPSAASGYLCIYEGMINALAFSGEIYSPDGAGPGVGVTGAAVVFGALGNGAYGLGTWAVTG